MAVDVPVMVTKFVKSHDDQAMSARCDLFESSHGEVLCCVLRVAKDETSVDIMCRRFCRNFLRKSRL
jgi:hypothetical protein